MMCRSTIEAYFEGAQNALDKRESLARGAFKLGIANNAVGDHIDNAPDEDCWVDDIQLRIGRLLLAYEKVIG